MIDKIKNLDNKDTFYTDVRTLLGNKHYSDAAIKNLQRVADARYENILSESEWEKKLIEYNQMMNGL